ncbi:hypothetical protein PUN28_015373 [Cardiocondyla obscurior]|uniref:Uncharacterized protein n=1 Tax=Cardiocondyla obscurior TaxID=286306 RepID=A0AAW2EX10_9HYME
MNRSGPGPEIDLFKTAVESVVKHGLLFADRRYVQRSGQWILSSLNVMTYRYIVGKKEREKEKEIKKKKIRIS